MSLTKSIAAALAWFGEQGGGRVKSEIGRVKSWGSFPVSLLILHCSPSLVALRGALLSGDRTVPAAEEMVASS
jgi:hypothetical protein